MKCFHRKRPSAREKPAMARQFRKWLTMFISCGLVLVLLASFFFLNMQARSSAKRLLTEHLDYLTQQIELKNESTSSLRLQNASSLFVKAYAVQKIVQADPLLLHDELGLARMCRSLGLDMLDVADASGTVVATWPHKTNYVGRVRFSDYDVTRKYMVLVTCPNVRIIEEPRQNLGVAATASYYYQFAGVARLDKPGIIQVGVSGKTYEASLEAVSISSIAPGYAVQNGGFVLVAEKNEIASAGEQSLLGKRTETLSFLPTDETGALCHTFRGGMGYFCAARAYGSYTVYAFLPDREAYSTLITAAIYMAVCCLAVFVITYIGLSHVTERVFASGIRRIGSYVNDVAAGDLSKLADIRDTSELSQLSDGVNSLVLALRRTFAEKDERISSALEENERIVSEREAFRTQACHDPLTGLLNRAGFLEICPVRLQEELAQGRMCALFMMDQDHFKSVNDTWGHAAGDSVLIRTAARLSGFFRAGDLVARIGGDEFCIFLQNVQDEEHTLSRAEALLGQLREPVAFEGLSIPVSCSLGAAFAPADGAAFDELYRAADAALYLAKSAGRDCCRSNRSGGAAAPNPDEPPESSEVTAP